MELQERLVLETERDTAVKSTRMLRMLLLNQSRQGRKELAILTSCHRCDWWLETVAHGRCRR